MTKGLMYFFNKTRQNYGQKAFVKALLRRLLSQRKNTYLKGMPIIIGIKD